MPHYLGIDVGTSAVKAILVDERQTTIAEADVSLPTSRPQDLWSEQDPDAWWQAVHAGLDQLLTKDAAALADVRGIGLSGQMHGAVLLDAANRPLRPAILWNDGRSYREAQELGTNNPGLSRAMGVRPLRPAILWNDGRSYREAQELGTNNPGLSRAMGVIPMPGFTAPKLVWLARHEPETFRAVRKVLLPKDYIRLQLTGAIVTDMSDAAGTWWLDEARRDWSDAALAATGLTRDHMASLVEGSQASGTLRPEIVQQWGMRSDVVVAGGGGDAATGAVGLGAIEDGSAFISLGTSGQLFVTTRDFSPAPEALVHSFCHALPGRWFQMAAMLNG
ncbi:FGGY family carbohydrate kinase, partial [Microvirga arabica]